MSPSSVRKGQTEPVAALAAAVVVGLALVTYAVAYEASLPAPVDQNVAQPTADRVERNVTVGGVVRPARLANATAVGPEGYRTNVTLVADGVTNSTGPAAPATADAATRRVGVYRGPGTTVPGRLEVRVWT